MATRNPCSKQFRYQTAFGENTPCTGGRSVSAPTDGFIISQNSCRGDYQSPGSRGVTITTNPGESLPVRQHLILPLGEGGPLAVDEGQ